MNRFSTLLLVAGALVPAMLRSAPAADNELTPQQKAEGWQCLFDGKTLDGWSVKSGFATYKADGGAVVGTTAADSPNTFLVSQETFRDFELTFDVRLDNNELNSGVQIRSKLRGDQYGGRVYGPQVEIAAGPGASGFIYGEAAGGWQSPEPESKDKSVSQHNRFKNGEWNHYRVRAVGRHIETWINGHKIADLVYDEKRYADNAEGFIGLQVHGVGKSGPFTVRWKNIFIKKLSDAK
jgi:hypothetical protein